MCSDMAHSLLRSIMTKYSRNGYFLFKCNSNGEIHSCLKDSLMGYGHLGSELRRNFINEWWYSTTFVEDVHPIMSSDFYNTSSLSDILPRLQSFGSNQDYTNPYGIALVTNSNNFRQDTDLSSVKEYCQLYYFVSSSDELDNWFVYWNRRRLKWWKQFSRYPERFTLVDTVSDICSNNNNNITDIRIIGPSHNRIQYIHSTDCKEILEDIIVLPVTNNNSSSSSSDPSHYCIVTSLRVDAGLITLMADAYRERIDDDRNNVLLKLHLRLCPLRVAVLPTEDCDVQSLFSKNLSRELRLAGITSKCFADGSLQSRLKLQDEIGTPFRALIDKTTLTNGILQLQDRNTGLLEPMESQSLMMTVLGMYQRFRDDN